MPERTELPTFCWGCGYATPFDMSYSFQAVTAALSLGAGFSLGYLSDFPGSPQFAGLIPTSKEPRDKFVGGIARLLGVLAAFGAG